MTVGHKDLLNRDYVEWFGYLGRAEGWNREQIEEHQLKRLRTGVRYAHGGRSRGLPGYKSLYGGGSAPAINSLEDFRQLPFLEREMLRDRLEDFSFWSHDRYLGTTGGTTGVPMAVYRNPLCFAKELASKAHQYYRVGWHEEKKQGTFRGLRIKTKNHTEFVPELNELRCSTYHMTPDVMMDYCRLLTDYRVQWLRGYPWSLYTLAKFMGAQGLDFPELEGLLLSSEVLYDFQGELFARVFPGTRVFSHYGHYEMAVLAGYCEYRDTYHVLPQYGYVELLDDDGAPVTEIGQEGEIVATSFIMDVTPIIRYRTHDRAIFGGWGCPECGRPYQIWLDVTGRKLEFVVAKDGRVVTTAQLAAMHENVYGDLWRFQYHQSKPGVLEFRYMARDTFTDWSADMIAGSLAGILGDIELLMLPTDEFVTSPTGKHPFLVQELDEDDLPVL